MTIKHTTNALAARLTRLEILFDALDYAVRGGTPCEANPPPRTAFPSPTSVTICTHCGTPVVCDIPKAS